MNNKRTQSWWDDYFLGLAEYVSKASKDPSTKVGAVLVGPEREFVSAGYNGFARGVEDTEARLGDREVKYKLVVHAERNAILFARRDLAGCTLYTWPMMPCAACAAMVIQTGVVRVVAPAVPADKGARWAAEFALAREQFAEAGVELIERAKPAETRP